MHKNDRWGDHQKFKELSALAQAAMLSSHEREELERHLQVCDSCQEIYDEYSLISTEGMPLLGAHYGSSPECENWDDRSARRRLLARIREAEQPGPKLVKAKGPGLGGFLSWEVRKYRAAAVGMAACLG